MRRRINPDTIKGIRKDFKSGKYRQIEIAQRWSCSVGFVNHVGRNLIHYDENYKPPRKHPLDSVHAFCRHKAGLSFAEIAKEEAIKNKRAKPLSAENIRVKVRAIEDAQKHNQQKR